MTNLPPVPCPACEGSGKSVFSRNGKCTVCRGRGEAIPAPEPFIPPKAQRLAERQKATEEE